MSRRDHRKKFEDKTLPEKKLEFRRHLRTYLVMVFMFFVISTFLTGGGWWIWPALGWGIGVAMQGLSIYGPLADPEDSHPREEDHLEPLPDLRDNYDDRKFGRPQRNPEPLGRGYSEEDLV
ncbi:2TM domain-containing protein [Lewinella sp. 4G2]|uniref:2TM domain-containing protein n=1 Tax=Lewinella sp. 4G2 TaxID=1803372 RepID=UPI0007B4D784|nr:2TM domain-containing protein [Lewinella sp. 4G2]OAV44656.1 hypothetical protein A3850_009205 [Lewinella sp. 4G2]